jgi:hypothetical protein
LNGGSPAITLRCVFSLLTAIAFLPLLRLQSAWLPKGTFAGGLLPVLLQTPTALQAPVQPTLSYFPPLLQLLVVGAAGCWCIRTIGKRRRSLIPKSYSQNLFISTTILVLATAAMVLSWNPAVPWSGGWTWQNTATPLTFIAAGIFSLFFLDNLSRFIEERLKDSILPPLCVLSALLLGFALPAIGLFSLIRAGAYAPPATAAAFQRMALWQMLSNCLLVSAATVLVVSAIYFAFRLGVLLHRSVGLFIELPVGVLEIEDLPCAVEQKFRELNEELADEGFVLLGCEANGRAFRNRHLYSAYWLQPQMGAVLKAHCQSLKPDSIARNLSFFLQTLLSDGSRVLTHPTRVLTFYDSPTMKLYGYDKIHDPLTLCQLHGANVLRHSAAGVTPELPRKGEEIDDLTQRANAELENWLKAGTVYRVHQSVRLTFKGSLRLLKQISWPLNRRLVQETIRTTQEHLKASGLEHWESHWQWRKKQRSRKKRGRPPRERNFA